MPTPLHEAKAELFRALAHPVRVRILELLLTGPHPVRAILSEIRVESSHLSQQLAVLRASGLVTAQRGGGTVVYALSTPEIADLMTAARRILSAVLTEREHRLDAVRALHAAE